MLSWLYLYITQHIRSLMFIIWFYLRRSNWNLESEVSEKILLCHRARISGIFPYEKWCKLWWLREVLLMIFMEYREDICLLIWKGRFLFLWNRFETPSSYVELRRGKRVRIPVNIFNSIERDSGSVVHERIICVTSWNSWFREAWHDVSLFFFDEFLELVSIIITRKYLFEIGVETESSRLIGKCPDSLCCVGTNSRKSSQVLSGVGKYSPKIIDDFLRCCEHITSTRIIPKSFVVGKKFFIAASCKIFYRRKRTEDIFKILFYSFNLCLLEHRLREPYSIS